MKTAITAMAIGLASFGAAQADSQITGAGSTFAAPIYAKWGEASAPTTGVKLNYQAIGSGAGINQINNRTVDFGASDMPVAADQLKEHKLMQFPTVIGGVDIIVNLPGVKANDLKLTGELLADIYLGKITKWNDPKIAALNPDVKLPSAGNRAGVSRRRVRHDFRLHRLPLHAEPRLEVKGRLIHQREMAGWHGRQGQ